MPGDVLAVLQMCRTQKLSCRALLASCNRRMVDTNEQENESCLGRFVSRSPESCSGRYVFRMPRVGRSRSILGLPPWMLIGTVLTQTLIPDFFVRADWYDRVGHTACRAPALGVPVAQAVSMAGGIPKAMHSDPGVAVTLR
jgi:hypothetical protein